MAFQQTVLKICSAMNGVVLSMGFKLLGHILPPTISRRKARTGNAPPIWIVVHTYVDYLAIKHYFQDSRTNALHICRGRRLVARTANQINTWKEPKRIYANICIQVVCLSVAQGEHVYLLPNQGCKRSRPICVHCSFGCAIVRSVVLQMELEMGTLPRCGSISMSVPQLPSGGSLQDFGVA